MPTTTGTINPSSWKTLNLEVPTQEKVFINQLVQYLQDGTKAVNNSINTLNNEVAGLTPAPPAVLVFLTAAYNAVAADINKYFVCSNGSWVLGLPAPATGLNYRVRNDQGISGTTGTITITPASGTIDGAVSLALLPGQEVTVFTDGTNWRTFGRQRVVILGTLDITASTASFVSLLPVGYRFFELDFEAFVGSADNLNVQLALSANGGSTYANNYYWGYMYNGTSTSGGSATAASTTAQIGNISAATGGQIQLKIYPGSSTQRPSYLAQSSFYYQTGAYVQNSSLGGFQNTSALSNALKVTLSSGTITNMFLTVKGIV